MQVRNRRDFWSGLLFMACATGFGIVSLGYDMGASSRLGPGFFPLALAAILFAIGSVVALRACATGAERIKVGRIHFKNAALILGAVAIFAVSLRHIGVLLSITLLVFIASQASSEMRLRQSLALTAGLVAVTYVVFVLGLGLQLPLLPAFLAP